MRIATLTLNPAIDQTVRVDNFDLNTVNKGHSMQLDAGGKGVNVASILADYGCDVVATGFLGADNTNIFERLFAAKGISDKFVRIPGQTRTNVKLVDEAKQQTTDINMSGQAPAATAIEELALTIEELMLSCDWFVLAGNLPPNVPASIYVTIINQLKKYGKSIVLDTSRDALQKAVLAGPTIIKPNLDELEQIVGYALSSQEEIKEAAKALLKYGIKLVIVSMGQQGALFVTQKRTFMAVPPSVSVKSTVGAGDAMVAGLIAGKIQGLSLPDCARLATAFSVGTITRVGPHLPASETLQSYLEQVIINY